MRDDYQKFLDRDAEILAIAPDGPRSLQIYWAEHAIPFPGLSDHGHTVADSYRQEVHLLKLGRMPAVLVIDKKGLIRYDHYGESMSDIPVNDELLDVLDKLNAEQSAA